VAAAVAAAFAETGDGESQALCFYQHPWRQTCAARGGNDRDPSAAEVGHERWELIVALKQQSMTARRGRLACPASIDARAGTISRGPTASPLKLSHFQEV
jgi:hypothetical protein